MSDQGNDKLIKSTDETSRGEVAMELFFNKVEK